MRRTMRTGWHGGGKGTGTRTCYRVYFVIEGARLQDSESKTRYFNRDLQWPLENPLPAPCRETDPLYGTAWQLVRAYGIDQAEAEPGFQGLKQDVAQYLLINHWPARRSRRGHRTIFEKDILIDSRTGRRLRELHAHEELGVESRDGEGGLLPVWYRWWSQLRDGKELSEVADWTEAQYGEGTWYDERSIRRAIQEVDRLMRPLTM